MTVQMKHQMINCIKPKNRKRPQRMNKQAKKLMKVSRKTNKPTKNWEKPR